MTLGTKNIDSFPQERVIQNHVSVLVFILVKLANLKVDR